MPRKREIQIERNSVVTFVTECGTKMAIRSLPANKAFEITADGEQRMALYIKDINTLIDALETYKEEHSIP